MPRRRPKRARVLVTLAIVAVTTGLGAARAARAADSARVRARKLFRAGEKAYVKGAFDAAIRAFADSLAARPHPTTRFNLAQSYRHQFERDGDGAKLQRAIALFRRALGELPKASWAATARRQLYLCVAMQRSRKPASQPAAPRPPPSTMLMIDSPTAGARIRIDGQPTVGDTAPAVRVVAPGAHVVEVFAPGHAPLKRSVVAVARRLVLREIALAPAPGRLRVEANVAGAAVFLDGRAAGRTPLARDGVAPGEHRVVVTARGHRTWGTSLRVEPARTAVSVATLRWSTQRKIALGVGGLSLASAAAALITGVLALETDASLDGLPRGDNSEREAWDARLAQRDRLSAATTALLIGAGVAAAAAALLYFLDNRGAPVAPARAGARSRASQRWSRVTARAGGVAVRF